MRINLLFNINKFVTLRFDAEWLDSGATDAGSRKFNLRISKTNLSDLLLAGTRFLAIAGEDLRISGEIRRIDEDRGFLLLACGYPEDDREILEKAKFFARTRN